MSKEKFTQGEWKVMNQTGRLDYSYMVYTGDECARTSEVESKANADLIAAAPDMYSKLKDLSKLMAMLDPYTPDLMELDCVTSEIDELLAKARGE